MPLHPQAVLDAALQRERLAGAPDEYAEAVGAWDAAEGAAAEGAGAAGGGVAATQGMKVVLITGFESFNVDLYKKVGCGRRVVYCAVEGSAQAVTAWYWAAALGCEAMCCPRAHLPTSTHPLLLACAGCGGTGARLPRHLPARLLRPGPGWVTAALALLHAVWPAGAVHVHLQVWLVLGGATVHTMSQRFRCAQPWTTPHLPVQP